MLVRSGWVTMVDAEAILDGDGAALDPTEIA